MAKFRAGERYELRRADGTWMEAYDHKAEDGQTISYRIDITERKRAEDALRRSKTNLKAAQQISSVGNWEISEAENIYEWSDEVYRILGVTGTRSAPLLTTTWTASTRTTAIW